MSDKVDFSNQTIKGLPILNAGGIDKIGYYHAIRGVSALQYTDIVKNFRAVLNSDKVIVAGEGVKINEDGTVTTLSNGETPDAIALAPNETGHSFSRVADSDSKKLFFLLNNNDFVPVIKFEKNNALENLKIKMEVSEDVEEGDFLVYDSDNLKLKRSTVAAPTIIRATFKALTNAKADESVDVIIKPCASVDGITITNSSVAYARMKSIDKTKDNVKYFAWSEGGSKDANKIRFTTKEFPIAGDVVYNAVLDILSDVSVVAYYKGE